MRSVFGAMLLPKHVCSCHVAQRAPCAACEAIGSLLNTRTSTPTHRGVIRHFQHQLPIAIPIFSRDPRAQGAGKKQAFRLVHEALPILDIHRDWNRRRRRFPRTDLPKDCKLHAQDIRTVSVGAVRRGAPRHPSSECVGLIMEWA